MFKCRYPQELKAQLDRIEQKLDRTEWKVRINMALLDALTAAVAEATTVEASAVILIEGIAQQLKDALAANDPTAVAALVAQLQTATAPLAAAVQANTPTPPAV